MTRNDSKVKMSASVCAYVCVYVYIYRHIPNPWELSLGAKEKSGNVLEEPMDKPGEAKTKTRR